MRTADEIELLALLERLPSEDFAKATALVLEHWREAEVLVTEGTSQLYVQIAKVEQEL